MLLALLLLPLIANENASGRRDRTRGNIDPLFSV